MESYRPVSVASVVGKFGTRLNGSLSLNPSSWVYGRAFLSPEINDTFPQRAPDQAPAQAI